MNQCWLAGCGFFHWAMTTFNTEGTENTEKYEPEGEERQRRKDLTTYRPAPKTFSVHAQLSFAYLSTSFFVP